MFQKVGEACGGEGGICGRGHLAAVDGTSFEKQIVVERSFYGCGKISTMTGVQFVTDDKGRNVAVLIDLKKHGARLQDFWDGMVSESRRSEVGVPLDKVRADLIRRGRLRE